MTVRFRIALFVFAAALLPFPAPAQEQQDNDPEALYSRGVRAERDKRYDDALKTFAKLAETHPKHNRAGCALTRAGLILVEFERYDEAIEAFQKVLRDHPQSKYGNGLPVAQFAAYNISVCYMEKGDPKKAQEAFDRAVKDYPDAQFEGGARLQDAHRRKLDPAEMLYDKGNREHRNRNYEQAAKVFAELAEKYPKHNRAGCGLATVARNLMAGGRYDEAIAVFDKVLANHRDSVYGDGVSAAALSAYYISFCHHKKGEVDKAAQAFDRAVADYPDARYHDGKGLQEMFFEMINAEAPKPAEGRAAVPADAATELYRRANRLHREQPQEALKLYQELAQKYPAHALAGAALKHVGTILLDLGRYDEAVVTLQLVIERYANSRFLGGGPVAPFAAFSIGDAYYRKKDMQSAKKALDLVLEKYPEALGPTQVALIRTVNAAVGKPGDAEEKLQAIERRAVEGGVVARLGETPDKTYARAEHLAQAQPEAAIKLYRDLIAEYPEDNLAGCSLARIADLLSRLGRYEEALSHSYTVLDLHPEARYPNGVPIAPIEAYKIGYFHFRKGEMQKARQAFDAALKEHPNARAENGALLGEAYAQAIKEVNNAAPKPQ